MLHRRELHAASTYYCEGIEKCWLIDIKTGGCRLTFIVGTDASARLPVYVERTRVDLGAFG
ncbi:MAG: hypothetical protein EOO38_11855 [Cytophagaceae bacterium]|nr:MAG: hypothetical protein EOO38_11855 [Cytophagaceae bacterium]